MKKNNKHKHKSEVWKLHNVESFDSKLEAEMRPKDFDKATREDVVIEVKGKRYTFLQTPLTTIVVKRGLTKKRKKEKEFSTV